MPTACIAMRTWPCGGVAGNAHDLKRKSPTPASTAAVLFRSQPVSLASAAAVDVQRDAAPHRRPKAGGAAPRRRSPARSASPRRCFAAASASPRGARQADFCAAAARAGTARRIAHGARSRKERRPRESVHVSMERAVSAAWEQRWPRPDARAWTGASHHLQPRGSAAGWRVQPGAASCRPAAPHAAGKQGLPLA
jgi:hypothetical protein